MRDVPARSRAHHLRHRAGSPCSILAVRRHDSAVGVFSLKNRGDDILPKGDFTRGADSDLLVRSPRPSKGQLVHYEFRDVPQGGTADESLRY